MRKSEQYLRLTGSFGKYQKILSLSVILTSFCLPFYLLIMPAMEKAPNFIYKDNDVIIENDINLFCQEIFYNKNYPEKEIYKNLNVTNANDSIKGWTYDLTIICNAKEIISLIGTVYFIASVLGIIIFSKFPDRYGRRTTFLVLNLFSFFSLIQLLYLKSYLQLIVTGFVLGLSSINLAVSSVILNENLDKDYAGIVMGITNSMFPLGGIISISLFYLFGNWKINLIITIIVFAICNILSILYLRESPKWLLVNQHYREFYETINFIAVTNGKIKINDTEGEMNIHKDLNIDAENSSNSLKSNNQAYEILDLIKFKDFRFKSLANGYLWIISGFSFFGILLNLAGLTGSLYIDAIVTYSAEFIAEIGSGICAQRYGTSRTLLYSIWIATISSISFYLIGSYFFAIKIALLFSAAIGIASVFNVLYIYTPQLYPTNIKSLAMGVFSLINRSAGGIVTIVLTYTTNITLIIGILFAVGIFVMTALHKKHKEFKHNSNDNFFNRKRDKKTTDKELNGEVEKVSEETAKSKEVNDTYLFDNLLNESF